MSLKTRVEALLKVRGMTKTALALALKITPQALNTYFVRDNPGQKTINRIAVALAVDPAELISEAEDVPHKAKDIIRIPIYDVDASAGHGCFHDGEPVDSFLAVRADIIRAEIPGDPARLVIIRVRGDSMAPTIQSNELIVVDVQEKSITADGIYAFLLNDVLVVKRIQQLATGEINIISDNQLYPPQKIPAIEAKDIVVVCGRVVAIAAMRKV